MKPQFIFSFLRVSTSILYFALIFLTVVNIVTCVLMFSGVNSINNSSFRHEVMAFGGNKIQPTVTYSADSAVSYSTIPDRFKLEVAPNSALGYFSFFSTMINLATGIAVLWLFRKIFSEINLKDSFKRDVHKRLTILAVIFVVSDVFTLIHYFIFNSLLRKSIFKPHFELITDVGDGLITGLIIYAIAIIYQKGISIQEENELTV